MCCFVLLSGFTPAYAGKILACWCSLSICAVHPRIRGEDYYTGVTAFRADGSPPHTRGRSTSSWIVRRSLRFTPAYAGKIRTQHLRGKCPAVHPRIRGEDNEALARKAAGWGSPPHTRGRFRLAELRQLADGFTPAYAGKIRKGVSGLRSCKVHPRIRGEDPGYEVVAFLPQGSPPHTRGRFEQVFNIAETHRFTPAYAGKMGREGHLCPWGKVHPRIRGEDCTSSWSGQAPEGSPPHTRGRCR